MPLGDEEAEAFSSHSYALHFRPDRPHVTLSDSDGHEVAELFALSSVHGSAPDDTTDIGSWIRTEAAGETVFSLEVTSSLWERKTVRFRCRPTRFVYEVEIAGTGTVTNFTPFGGFMSALPRWGSGFFPSGHAFTQLFNPEPNTLDHNYLSADSGTVIDLTGAPLPGKRHWFFTPAPMCFAAQAAGRWVGLGIEAQPGSNRFSAYRYHGGDGFWLALAYDGDTAVDGRMILPGIGFDFGPDEFSVLRAHVAALRRGGMAPDVQTSKPDWWGLPMFCGWGAQCARAGDVWGREDGRRFLAAMSHAAEYARQTEYQQFLTALSLHGLRPGTVVIDDKWQESYGDNRVDAEKWPDLRGFVAARHVRNQHVLLWLKAWDREGVPDEECICNASGRPLAVDPTNPAYEARLRETIRRMLGPDGYDADGFKIDFTHRIPVGPGLRVHGEARGLELMKTYLGVIYDEAKKVKADALVMTHAPHPYLADVTDMIRLNDMLDLTRLDDPSAGLDIQTTLKRRAAIARIACPDALIDTDNWPVRNRAAWRDFVRLQPSIGVPSLYFSTHIDLTGEPLEEADYQLLHEAWNGIDSTHPVAAG